jgi:transposase-like protein
MDGRKRYTGEQKAEILRDLLENKKGLGEVATAYGVHPNAVLKWRKQLLESASEVFAIKRPDVTAKAEAKKAAELAEQLAKKDEVIAELAQELLALKKKSSGQTSGNAR